MCSSMKWYVRNHIFLGNLNSRSLQLRSVADSEELHESAIARYLLKNPSQAHGTVEGTAQAWDEAVSDGKQ